MPDGQAVPRWSLEALGDCFLRPGSSLPYDQAIYRGFWVVEPASIR